MSFDSITVTTRQQGILTLVEVDTFRHLSNSDLRFLAQTRPSGRYADELARREQAGIDHVPSDEDRFAVSCAMEQHLEGRMS